MAQIPSRNTVTNHILAGLSAQDFARLAPHLDAVDLPLRKMLEPRQRKITNGYFPKAALPRSSPMEPAGRPSRSA